MEKEEFEIILFNDKIKEKLNQYCIDLEKKVGRSGIGEIIFQVLYELINNAIKANLKRIFFIKKGYSFEKKEEYQKGLEEFRKEYQSILKKNIELNGEDSKIKQEWLKAIEDLNLKVRLVVDLNYQRIIIYVINNTKILPDEEKRLRESLSIAMKSKDLMDFIINYGFLDKEGEGLGLPLVVLLLKEGGFKPEYFRIYKDNQNTIARLEFPLSMDYVPIREKWHTL